MGLVYSIHDSTEVAIQKMIDASQRMIDVQRQVQGEARKEGWGINPVMKRHLELEIKTLQNAPRDAAKLRRLLEIKQRQKEEAFLLYCFAPLRPFFNSSKFIAGWNSTLAPIRKNGSAMAGILSTDGTSTMKMLFLSPFSSAKYAASALLFSMKSCIFLRKFGSLTALFPASVGKIKRTMNRTCCPFYC